MIQLQGMILCLLSLMPLISQAQTIRRVDVNSPCPSGCDGSTWALAYPDLQTALAAAVSGDTLWVAAGTYKPTTGSSRDIFFSMKNDVAIYGGFDGTEALLSERDWVENVTILSGDIGIIGDNSDNTYNVVYNLGINDGAILDGFTISGGKSVNYGGGMYNSSSSPTLANCTFSGNIANSGGGMYNHSSYPTLTNCTFHSNSADNYGGSLYNHFCSPTLTNCTFYNNSANSGGGIRNHFSSPTLTNCTFLGNIATLGGGVYSYISSPRLTNCTFSGNSAESGGGMMNYYSSPTLTNCILWGNSSEINGSATVTYSIVQQAGGVYPGVGNLNANPLFVNPPDWHDAPTTAGDLRLQACSPALDAGNDAANNAPLDPDGNPRKFDAIPGGAQIDMGAYEHQAVKPIIACYRDQDGDGYGDPGVAQSFCNTCGAGYVPDNTDCDDADIAINPAATEVCDEVDNDCDGLLDADDPNLFDGTPPEVVCKNTVVYLDASGTGGITPADVFQSGSDNCGAVEPSFVSPSSFTCNNLGDNIVTLTAADISGNSAECTANVTVQDQIKPYFTAVPANVTVQCATIPAVGTATATDNCDNSVSVTYNGQTAIGACTLIRQWTAADESGNTRTATQKITVQDIQRPNFVGIPANVTVQCNTVPAPATPTATDNCAIAVTITYNGETRTNGPCSNAYTLTRRWTAADNCGNTRSASHRITVVDNGKPTLAVPADTTIACTETLPAVGVPTASDGCGGTVTIVYLGQTTANATCPGNYQIRRIWRATDACGNSTVATQTIQVQDTEPPVFTYVPAPVTIECTQLLPPLVNPAASDACGGYVHITFLGKEVTGSGCENSYTVTCTWQAADLCGHTTTATQVITVEPAPVDFKPQHPERAEHWQAETRQNVERQVPIRPNPTTDRIWIDLADFIGEPVTVLMYNDMGKLAWERRVEATEGRLISMSLREAGAPAGLYTVCVRSGEQIVSKRVILVE